MTVNLQSFPVVPPQRSALTSADIRSYITAPTQANFETLKTAVEALQASAAALPVTTRSGTLPNSAAVLDRWVVTSSNNQEKICITAYTPGNGTTANWVNLRDSVATTLSTTLANANSPDSGHLSSLKAQITAMEADTALDNDETTVLNALKAELQTRYTAIVSNATSYSLTGNATYTNYTAAYTVWQNLPPVPANPLPANFDTVWNDLLDKEALILSLIRTTGTALLTTLNGNVTAIQNTVDNMALDSKITPQEKIALKPEYNRIKGEYTKIVAVATSLGHTGVSQYTTLQASYAAWLLLIDTTINVFGNMATTSTIPSVSAWNLAWDNYYLDAKAFDNFVDTDFKTDLDTFGSTLSTITTTVNNLAADGIISGGSEKRLLKQSWLDIVTQHTVIVAHAGTYSVAVPGTYTTAYNNLNTYLNTTLTVFANMETNTAVDRGVMEGFFSAYRTQYEALANTIATSTKGATDGISSSLALISATVNALASDGVISGGSEKRILKQLWNDIVAQNTVIVAHAGTFSVAVPSAYTTAYSNLDTYLNTTLVVFGDMAGDTNVVRATMEAFFDEYRNRYSLLASAVSVAQASAITSATPAGYAAFTATIESIASDGIISAGAEKQRMNALWNDISATHASFVAQAAEAGISSVDLVNKYNAISTYLGTIQAPAGGAPNFTITNQDSAIGSAAFYQVFRDYEASKGAMNESIIAGMFSTVRDSVQSIADMNNDGVITPIEKTTLDRIWKMYGVERNNAVTQANALSIVTERDAMTTAYTALDTYLNTTIGLFDDMAVTTTLTTPQNNDWDLKWFDYETKYQALITIIQSTQIANNISVSNAAFKHNGSVTATGVWNMGGFKITNGADATIANLSKELATGGQIYAEQVARTAAVSASQSAVQGNLDAETATRVANDNAIAATVVIAAPPGAVSMYVGEAAPSGWFLCDGQAISRTTYAALFAVISTTYGVGNGTTTFNIPNCKGRAVVGLDAGQTEFDALAETGGAKTHTLSVAELAAHDHGTYTGTETDNHTHSFTTDTDGAHTHTYDKTSNQMNVDGGNAFGVLTAHTSVSTGSNAHAHSGTTGGHSQAHTHPITSAGSNTAHNNLQPYIVMNYIIKT